VASRRSGRHHGCRVGGYFGDNLGLIVLYVAFYLLLRPLFFGSSAAFNGIVLPPNLSPLIQSACIAGRWVIR
jgi:hypothetical protein